MTAPKQYMSRSTLAEALDISASTVDEMVRGKDLPEAHFRQNGEPFWDWTRVEQYFLNKPKLGVIYFVGFGEYVKIGFTSAGLEYRLASIQTGCPERLTIFATTEGTVAREREIHAQFKDHRLNGEWFRKCPEILAFMEGLK